MSCPSNSSSTLTVATTVVCNSPARVTSIILNPAAAASTITLYDNASAASGTVLAKLQAVANGESVVWHLDGGLICNNGITAVVAGASATAVVGYQRN